MTLQQLAERIGARLEGDGTLAVARVAALDTAGPGDVTFLANQKYAAGVAGTKASAVILGASGPPAPCAVLRVDNPYLAFARAAQALAPPSVLPVGVHPTAVLGDDVVLGEGVGIGPLAVIGRGARLGARTVIEAHAVVGPEAVIGDDCLVHGHVSIRERCRLGDRVVVQNGAVIGADGFGFAHHADGAAREDPADGPGGDRGRRRDWRQHHHRPAGGGRDAHQGRAPRSTTWCRSPTAWCSGASVLLAAQVGISGSTTVGDAVVLAGQVGVAGHITIGDRVDRDRPDRHHQLGRRGQVHLGLSGHRQPRMAQGRRAGRTAARDRRHLLDLDGGSRRSKRGRGSRPGRRHPRAIIEAPMNMFVAPVVDRVRRRALLAVCAGRLALAALWTPLSAAVAPPKLEYQRFTLAERPHRHPAPRPAPRRSCTSRLWYHVGSKNEQPGRTGFAHLFEHMMFKGSKNVEPEQHTSIVSSVGGQRQRLHQRRRHRLLAHRPVPVPAAGAVDGSRPYGLAAHRRADLHQRARSGEGGAAHARRQPAVRQPQRAALPARLHRPSLQAPGRSAAWPTSMPPPSTTSATSSTPTTCPANATMVIVGDFDVAETTDLVTRYYRRVSRGGPGTVPRDIPEEPKQTEERRVTLEEPWPLPAVIVALPHHLRRPPRLVSAARARQGALRRQQLAHLSQAGLREAAGAWPPSAAAT